MANKTLTTMQIFCLVVIMLLSVAPAVKPYKLGGIATGINDIHLYERVIQSEKPPFKPPNDVSGITVPHHLLAADIIARGFWAASAKKYKRVILISPDHFRRHMEGVAILNHDVKTVFGDISSDKMAIASLSAAKLDFVHVDQQGKSTGNDGKPIEHGLFAVAPFVKYFFPESHIIPISIGIATTPEQWIQIANIIEPLLGKDTLIVQSTDFSHYLSLGQATLEDQVTLNVISAGSHVAVSRLNQPDNLDSKAALAIQLDLLISRLNHHATVIAQRNSSDYVRGGEDNTTSYLTIVYTHSVSSGNRLIYDDHRRLFFGGDTFLGRHFKKVLNKPEAAKIISNTITKITDNAPLVVNIEGTILPQDIPSLPDGLLNMVHDQVSPILRDINVLAASLANNHSHDLGKIGLNSTIQLLNESEIHAMRHGEIVDLDMLSILSVNHLKGRGNDVGGFMKGLPDSEICFKDAKLPAAVYAHWGQEYIAEFDSKTAELALAYAKCGFQLIIGSHSHVASKRPVLLGDGEAIGVYSLGNLAFDQSGKRSSGSLLEVRIFSRGTFAIRLIPIPNFYDILK